MGAGSASEDAPGKADKRLTNICPIACTCFNVSEFVTLCELFSFGKSNDTVFTQVAVATDQDHGDRQVTCIAYIAYIVQPDTEVVKCLAVGDVKNEDDAPTALRQYALAIERKRSWPGVSETWRFTCWPSTSMGVDAESTQMVVGRSPENLL